MSALLTFQESNDIKNRFYVILCLSIIAYE